MRDFLTFRTMVTPMFIETLWLAVSLLMVAGGLFVFLEDMVDDGNANGVGLAVAVIGPFALRIYFELIIVVFKIHDRLGQILDATEDKLEATEDLVRPSG